MKLRNKKTGEILGSLGSFILQNPNGINCEAITKYNSLAELNEDWEDYEEPDEIYYIDWKGDIRSADINNEWECEKEIGNYFETKEEAEKAVEKLKAWKRLKDKGFRINGWFYALEGNRENGSIPLEIKVECKRETPYKDIDLLFGGKE